MRRCAAPAPVAPRLPCLAGAKVPLLLATLPVRPGKPESPGLPATQPGAQSTAREKEQKRRGGRREEEPAEVEGGRVGYLGPQTP